MVRWSEPHSSWPSLWLQAENSEPDILPLRPSASMLSGVHTELAHIQFASPSSHVCAVTSFTYSEVCLKTGSGFQIGSCSHWCFQHDVCQCKKKTKKQTNQNKTQKKSDFSLFPKITWLQFYILGSLKTASDVSNRLKQRGAVINESLRWELGEHALHFHSFFSTILSWSHCSRDLDAACYPGR